MIADVNVALRGGQLLSYVIRPYCETLRQDIDNMTVTPRRLHV